MLKAAATLQLVQRIPEVLPARSKHSPLGHSHTLSSSTKEGSRALRGPQELGFVLRCKRESKDLVFALLLRLPFANILPMWSSAYPQPEVDGDGFRSCADP
jgi:hypothetical protein